MFRISIQDVMMCGLRPVNLKRSVGGQHSRTWRSEERENFRSEARDSGQNVLTDELPDRFEFELLRSTFESVDQRMNSPEQHFRFVGLGMLRSNTEMFCAAMSGLARHRREQKRAAGDRFQAGFGIPQPHK